MRSGFGLAQIDLRTRTGRSRCSEAQATRDKPDVPSSR
jgi:hypothetical protein